MQEKRSRRVTQSIVAHTAVGRCRAGEMVGVCMNTQQQELALRYKNGSHAVTTRYADSNKTLVQPFQYHIHKSPSEECTPLVGGLYLSSGSSSTGPGGSRRPREALVATGGRPSFKVATGDTTSCETVPSGSRIKRGDIRHCTAAVARPDVGGCDGVVEIIRPVRVSNLSVPLPGNASTE